MALKPERLLSVQLWYIQKSLSIIYEIKVPKKEAFMITIITNFFFFWNTVVCQWCISRFPIEIKLAVFPALHMFRSGLENHCFLLFCPKITQNPLRWFLDGFLVGLLLLLNHIEYPFEIWGMSWITIAVG